VLKTSCSFVTFGSCCPFQIRRFYTNTTCFPGIFETGLSLIQVGLTRGIEEPDFPSKYLSNEPTWCTKSCFYIKFIKCLYMFRALCSHHQEVKLYYTASGIVTPVGGRPVHRCDDARCCIIQF
jgi:hypothetical protein